MKSLSLLLLLLVLFVSVGQLRGQSGRKGTQDSKSKPGAKASSENSDNGVNESKISAEGETVEGDVIRFDTSLVTVPVTVVDRSGGYVPLLQKDDFHIFEDGVEQ